MGLDDLRSDPTRKVWENTNGTSLLVVTGLLNTGEYTVKRNENDDGVVELTFIPQQNG